MYRCSVLRVLPGFRTVLRSGFQLVRGNPYQMRKPTNGSTKGIKLS
jgi:hypothetical protein